MKILDIKRYRDGGSFEVFTEEKVYSMTTDGEFFEGFLTRPETQKSVSKREEFEVMATMSMLAIKHLDTAKAFARIFEDNPYRK